MYTCRKCKTNLNDNDRFCFKCGAYIGEPIRMSGTWEDINLIEEDSSVKVEVVADDAPMKENTPSEEHPEIEITKNKSNNIIRLLLNLIFRPISSITRYCLDLKLGVSLALFAVLCCLFGGISVGICRLLFSSSEEAINSLLSFGGMGKNIQLLNIPEKNTDIFLNGAFMFLFSVIIFYCAIYLIARFIFRASGDIVYLWNVVICALVSLTGFTVIALALWKFEVLLSFAGIFTGSIIFIIALYTGIKNAFKITDNRAVITVPMGCIILLSSFYLYIAAMMQ